MVKPLIAPGRSEAEPGHRLREVRDDEDLINAVLGVKVELVPGLVVWRFDLDDGGSSWDVSVVGSDRCRPPSGTLKSSGRPRWKAAVLINPALLTRGSRSTVTLSHM
jgi:hypothetical protein